MDLNSRHNEIIVDHFINSTVFSLVSMKLKVSRMKRNVATENNTVFLCVCYTRVCVCGFTGVCGGVLVCVSEGPWDLSYTK